MTVTITISITSDQRCESSIESRRRNERFVAASIIRVRDERYQRTAAINTNAAKQLRIERSLHPQALFRWNWGGSAWLEFSTRSLDGISNHYYFR
jgi:hypothetical protein